MEISLTAVRRRPLDVNVLNFSVAAKNFLELVVGDVQLQVA